MCNRTYRQIEVATKKTEARMRKQQERQRRSLCHGDLDCQERVDRSRLIQEYQSDTIPEVVKLRPCTTATIR